MPRSTRTPTGCAFSPWTPATDPPCRWSAAPEPSYEVDIRCRRTKDGIELGTGDDWLEILGSGMVHPNVLANCGIDPDRYQGFAWGIGIDRIAMLKYGMPDLRAFFDGDARWLSHYGFAPFDRPSLAGGLSK